MAWPLVSDITDMDMDWCAEYQQTKERTNWFNFNFIFTALFLISSTKLEYVDHIINSALNIASNN